MIGLITCESRSDKTNKNIKISSYKSSETFKRKRVGQTDLFQSHKRHLVKLDAGEMITSSYEFQINWRLNTITCSITMSLRI